MGQKRWVVVNTAAITRELLDKRGRLYISRPYFPVTQDILSGGNRIIIMQHGERWRNLRKVMHQLLTARQVRRISQKFDNECLLTMCRLIAINRIRIRSLASCCGIISRDQTTFTFMGPDSQILVSSWSHRRPKFSCGALANFLRTTVIMSV